MWDSTGTMSPDHLWLKNQLQSRRQNLLGSISSASSDRNCSPELSEMPSHASSQINSVRVTQVVLFWRHQGVRESCRGLALCSKIGVPVERLHHCESSASVVVEGVMGEKFKLGTTWQGQRLWRESWSDCWSKCNTIAAGEPEFHSCQYHGRSPKDSSGCENWDILSPGYHLYVLQRVNWRSGTSYTGLARLEDCKCVPDIQHWTW